jgi:hypothetical protein
MAIMNKHYHIPALPVELNCQILEEAWRLPLTRTERRDILVALPLVCTSFRWITNRLFLRDAHIVSPTYAAHFLSLLQQQQQQQHDPDASPAAHSSSGSYCCQSITFHIYDPDASPTILRVRPASPIPAARALETTLRTLSRDPAALAPSLRRVALHYTGCSFTHELDEARLVHLPPHVRALELRFATPAPFVQHLRQIYHRRYVLPMSGVRSLSIYGTCPAFVADVARACPALESLETDDVRGVLELQPSLLPLVSPMVLDATQVNNLVVSDGQKERSRGLCDIPEKYETKTRDWKRGRRAGGR